MALFEPDLFSGCCMRLYVLFSVCFAVMLYLLVFNFIFLVDAFLYFLWLCLSMIFSCVAVCVYVLVHLFPFYAFVSRPSFSFSIYMRLLGLLACVFVCVGLVMHAHTLIIAFVIG